MVPAKNTGHGQNNDIGNSDSGTDGTYGGGKRNHLLCTVNLKDDPAVFHGIWSRLQSAITAGFQVKINEGIFSLNSFFSFLSYFLLHFFYISFIFSFLIFIVFFM